MKYNVSVLLSVGLTITMAILLFSEVDSSLKRTEDIETTVINQIFEDVVKCDRDIRIEGYNRIIRVLDAPLMDVNSVIYETSKGSSIYKKSIDSLSIDINIDDKEFVASQLFLMEKKPIKASVLDSMLQVNLRTKGIIAQTAVSYQGKLGDIVHKEISTLDGRPLSDSQSLSPLNFSIPAMGFEIKIEGYVKYPLGYLWKKTPNLTWILLVYIIPFIFSVLFTIACIKKRVCQLALPLNSEFIQYQEVESSPLPVPVVKAISPGITEEIPEKSDAEIQITDELFINKYTGEIRLKKEIVLQLKEYRFKLFLFLLDGPDYCQTNEKIKEAVWQNKNTLDATINKTAGRLRIDLKSAAIPIKIKNIRATGYQIKV